MFFFFVSFLFFAASGEFGVDEQNRQRSKRRRRRPLCCLRPLAGGQRGEEKKKEKQKTKVEVEFFSFPCSSTSAAAFRTSSAFPFPGHYAPFHDDCSTENQTSTLSLSLSHAKRPHQRASKKQSTPCENSKRLSLIALFLLIGVAKTKNQSIKNSQPSWSEPFLLLVDERKRCERKRPPS